MEATSEKKTKKVKWFSSYRFYGIVWLATIVICIFWLIPKASNPTWGEIEILLWLSNVILGVTFFCIMVFILMIRYKWARYFFGISFSLCVIGIVGLIVLVVSNNPEQQASELIACYVDGTPIMATRDNCAKLSIQKEQPKPEVRIIQQQPAYQPQTIKMIEPPTKCTTSEDYLSGNLVTRCQKSWF